MILRVLLEAGEEFVEIKKTKKDDKDWIDIKVLKKKIYIITVYKVDRSKINTVGFPALKKFLLKMMVYKSTADLENAQSMFEDYAKVNEHFIELRNIVVENKQPRRLELQGHLELVNNDKVIYHEFEENIEGIIESFIKRFENFDKEVFDLWKEYKEYY